MRNTHGTRFRIAAAVLGLLLSAPPGAALAVVSELSLTNVPPDTKVTLIGEDRSDRVEARTKEQGGDGRLSFQLQERNWPSGSYILNIYEPAGALVSELIELKDGGNEIDLATILGAPLVSTAGSASAAQPNPGVAGALAGAPPPARRSAARSWARSPARCSAGRAKRRPQRRRLRRQRRPRSRSSSPTACSPPSRWRIWRPCRLCPWRSPPITISGLSQSTHWIR